MKTTNIYKLFNGDLPTARIDGPDGDILHGISLTPGAVIEISEATKSAAFKLLGKYLFSFEVTEEVADLLLCDDVTLSSFMSEIVPWIEEVYGSAPVIPNGIDWETLHINALQERWARK